MAVLREWHASKIINVQELVTWAQSLANTLINTSHFHEFSIVDRSGGGSHFSIYIPNTRKSWPQAEAAARYRLNPRLMSTINTWLPSEAGAHQTQITEALSPWSVSRCLEGFKKAGLTLERLDQVENSAAKRRASSPSRPSL
jgi:hypothetical protein